MLAENDGRIAVWSDEGETVKVIAGRYSKDQSPSVEVFLKGHAGGYYSSSRVGRAGISLQDPAITMVLSIQPEVIRGLSNQRALHGQGFFARYLYALPPSALGSRRSKPDPVDEGTKKAYDELIRILLDVEAPKDDFEEVMPHAVRFSEETDELLEDLQDWVEPQLGPSGDMAALREWGSKLAGEIVRIAGVLHAADRAAAGDKEPWKTPVPRGTLKRAIEIGLCYLEHTRATMHEMGADPRIAAARHVLEVLKSAGVSRISKRDLFDKVRKDSRFRTMQDLEKILEVLEQYGYVRELKPKRRGPGRPKSPTLEINPLSPAQNPQNPQNSRYEGAKSFFEWLKDRRGHEDPDDPPPSGQLPRGPRPDGSGPAYPLRTEPDGHKDVRSEGRGSGVVGRGPSQNGHTQSPQADYGAHKAFREGFELIDDQTRLGEVIADLEGSAKIGLDLETTGLRWWDDKIRLLSITTKSGRTWLIDAFAVDVRPLFPTLQKAKIVAHNAQFDLLFLKRLGFEPEGCSCTMVLSQMLWAGKQVNDKFHSLEAVAKRVVGKDLDKGHQKVDWSGKLSDEMLEYAARDSKILLPLYEELTRLIEKAGGMGWVVELEERMLKTVTRMAEVGVPIDNEKWADYVRLVEEEKRRLVTQMDAHVATPLPEAHTARNTKNKQLPEERNERVNWQSSDQRAWILESLGFKLPRTEKGKPSTDKDALKEIDHPLARAMERFNAIRNVAKTFGEALQDRVEGNRLHCDWRQNEAGTGRMSCRKPPLQGVPSESELRKAVKAPARHKLVISDLSQIEVRVLAALSGDKALKEAFEHGLDIHRSVARRVLGREEVTDEERRIAKALVFGNMYGQGVEGMRRQIENRLGRPFSQEEAEEYWSSFFDAYPHVKRWRERVAAEFDIGYRETRTRKGRRRIDVDTKPKRWNTPIQGLAADALKAIAVAVDERRGEVTGLELVALVHDEVICTVPEERAEEAAEWLTQIMESVADEVVNENAPLEERVAIKADTSVCVSWGDK